MAAASGLTKLGTTVSVASSSATSNSVPIASTNDDGVSTPQYLRAVSITLIGVFSNASLRTSYVVVRDFTST